MANGPPTRAAAKSGPRSNFAEFRRQMKMKTAAAVVADVTTSSPSRHSPRSGMMHAVICL